MNSPDENQALISAGKVQGTPVLNANGESLGSIYDVMLEKRTGRIAYAVLTFGGFLGVGKKYVPLPWAMLTYKEQSAGYVVSIPKEALENGPTLDEQATWHPEVGKMIETYYEIYTKTH